MDHTACTEPQCLYSRAMPLLSLWTILPVQSLSACTVQLYLYSPYGLYGLYRASVRVQVCTLHFTFSGQCSFHNYSTNLVYTGRKYRNKKEWKFIQNVMTQMYYKIKKHNFKFIFSSSNHTIYTSNNHHISKTFYDMNLTYRACLFKVRSHEPAHMI
jgi:hypothetical protein